MAIRFQCPKCESWIRAPEEGVGKKGKCPKCRETLRVPSPDLAEAAGGLAETEPTIAAEGQPPLPEGETPDSPSFSMVWPTSKTLKAIVADTIRDARRAGLRPFVYFFADTSDPRGAFASRFAHPRVAEALEGTYIVQLAAEQWRAEAADIGFSFLAAPAFVRLDDRERATGSIGGTQLRTDSPEHMGQALKAFLQATSLLHSPSE